VWNAAMFEMPLCTTTPKSFPSYPFMPGIKDRHISRMKSGWI
jgi:hypothetical protein